MNIVREAVMMVSEEGDTTYTFMVPNSEEFKDQFIVLEEDAYGRVKAEPKNKLQILEVITAIQYSELMERFHYMGSIRQILHSIVPEQGSGTYTAVINADMREYEAFIHEMNQYAGRNVRAGFFRSCDGMDLRGRQIANVVMLNRIDPKMSRNLKDEINYVINRYNVPVHNIYTKSVHYCRQTH